MHQLYKSCDLEWGKSGYEKIGIFLGNLTEFHNTEEIYF